MRKFLFLLVLALWLPVQAQTPPGMKVYYFVLLTSGPHRDQDEATAERIQSEHLANIERLGREGKLDLAGPFMDDGDWRGLFLFNVATREEVEALLESDPAIRAGRLNYEIHPWLGQQGAQLR